MLPFVKVKNKSDLIKYDLDINIFKKYDFKVLDIIPVRKIYILETDKGYKVFKRLNYSLENYNFILKGLEYIKSNGFRRVISIDSTIDGKPYLEWKGELYCVMDMVDGRESQFSNPIDVEMDIEGIANLHLASEGFKFYNTKRNICGNMIHHYRIMENQMKIFYGIADMGKNNEFDIMFKSIFSEIIAQINKSIRILEKSCYYKLCSREDKIVLCHHDLAHHNILIKDDKAYFIDFDYAVIDLKVHDLCNFINKIEKNSYYDFKDCKQIIKNYDSINSLDEMELSVLYGFLTFPKDIYDILRNYYTRAKEWDYETFLNRLQLKIDLHESKEEFLELFNKEYLG
ncbi:CotS family spore coat protein [Clostridium grantii]|uniref:Spore coat protein, CotS family n=1 Tax=Clostridium grantii DSM 8605 TaxID=1121316 RepID=A0A1M5XDH9_9CLOT|nr:CotS family spore coat protein [Clostridium grantii]SHH97598.1 spore coat protein, CotS family [Clostridium grantii DSM 8605]